MSATSERIMIMFTMVAIMSLYLWAVGKKIDNISNQLTSYQNSVNVLIQENKKLHVAQMMYSDAIVTAIGIKPIDLVKLRQRYEYATKKATVAIERTKKFMTLQEVEHGKD